MPSIPSAQAKAWILKSVMTSTPRGFRWQRQTSMRKIDVNYVYFRTVSVSKFSNHSNVRAEIQKLRVSTSFNHFGLTRAPRYLKRWTNERNKDQGIEKHHGENDIKWIGDRYYASSRIPVFRACEGFCESLSVRLKHGRKFCRSWKPDFAQSAPSSRGFPWIRVKSGRSYERVSRVSRVTYKPPEKGP